MPLLTVELALFGKNKKRYDTVNGDPLKPYAPEEKIRYGTVRYGTVRYGTVRYGTVRYGTVRYGTVRVTNSDALLYIVFNYTC